MDNKLIIRTYLALARNEHFVPSELGDTLDFVAPYSGRTVGSYPLAQLNYEADDATADLVSFEAGIIKKPSHIQNLVYSSELRRIFGEERLRFTGLFDRDGNFKLPVSNGYIAFGEKVEALGKQNKRAA